MYLLTCPIFFTQFMYITGGNFIWWTLRSTRIPLVFIWRLVHTQISSSILQERNKKIKDILTGFDRIHVQQTYLEIRI
jgi:hypothetical protein